MQYKTLATLLFATAVIAAPKPQDDNNISDSDYSNYDYSDYSDYDDIPTSIEAVIETAIPTTWLESFYTDEAFYSSEVAAMAKGDYPDWVSSMPSDARAWATSVLHEEMSDLTATDVFISATDSGAFPLTPTTGATATATDSGSVTHITGTKSAETTSTGSSTASTTGSESSSTDASSSAASSSAAASSSSTGGAPAATGSLAMGLAGAAGILGVALAL